MDAFCTINILRSHVIYHWPFVKIGRKMANDQLLFLALLCEQICQKGLAYAIFHCHLTDTVID